MRIKLFLLITLAICCLASCNESDFLDGYDRAELFATPTQQELEAVATDWASRDLSPKDYNVEETIKVAASGTTLKILSFKVGPFKEYGALLIPKSGIDLPVHLYIGGFGQDITTNSINVVEKSDTASNEPSILAVPALRGQSLSVTIDGTEYTTPISEGEHCDAFDHATDDAIAFLNIIEETEDRADVNRVAVRGGSRGGTVALLMGERDKRVKLAVDVAGPTNMLELTAQNENDATYQCQFLEDLTNGILTVPQLRHKMIASSPVFFASDLPKTQVHLAANDKIVPVSQGDQLKQKMDDLGLNGIFEIYIYEGKDHSDIASNNKTLNDRVEEFLSQL